MCVSECVAPVFSMLRENIFGPQTSPRNLSFMSIFNCFGKEGTAPSALLIYPGMRTDICTLHSRDPHFKDSQFHRSILPDQNPLIPDDKEIKEIRQRHAGTTLPLSNLTGPSGGNVRPTSSIKLCEKAKTK